jgi:prevent-host-death family protein
MRIMATYSVAQARNHLSELIDRALEGEDVTITRHGQVVARLRSAKPSGRRMTADDVARLRRNQIVPRAIDGNPISIVERMRDEDARRLLRR